MAADHEATYPLWLFWRSNFQFATASFILSVSAALIQAVVCLHLFIFLLLVEGSFVRPHLACDSY